MLAQAKLTGDQHHAGDVQGQATGDSDLIAGGQRKVDVGNAAPVITGPVKVTAGTGGVEFDIQVVDFKLQERQAIDTHAVQRSLEAGIAGIGGGILEQCQFHRAIAQAKADAVSEVTGCQVCRAHTQTGEQVGLGQRDRQQVTGLAVDGHTGLLAQAKLAGYLDHAGYVQGQATGDGDLVTGSQRQVDIGNAAPVITRPVKVAAGTGRVEFYFQVADFKLQR